MKAALRQTLVQTVKRSDAIIEAIEKAGYKAGEDIYLGMDVASSNSNKETGKYDLAGEGRRGVTSEEMVAFYEELVNEFPIHLHRRRPG